MKLPCEIMEDLLPLYAEDMTTDVTRAAVEEHLEDCEPCREKLKGMRGEKPDQSPAMALKPVQKELNRRRWNMVIAAVCAVAVVLLVVFSVVTRPIYIPYSEDAVTIEAPENGWISMTFHGAAEVDGGTWSEMDDTGNITTGLYLTPWYSLLSRWMGGVKDYTLRVPEDRVVWYANMVADGELVPLIAAPETWWSGGGRVLPRLVLNYFMLMAAGAAIVLLGLWYLLRRKRIGRLLKPLCLLPLCYIAANGLVNGYGAASYHASRDFLFIALITLCLWGFVTAGARLVRQAYLDRK